MRLKKLLLDMMGLFFPQRCIVCDAKLLGEEQHVCLACMLKLPKTGFHLTKDNRTVARFYGKIPVVRGASWLYYEKGGISQRLIEALKYGNNRDIGKWAGCLVAQEWLASGFFADIDLLLPIPLHPSKEKRRGFNQSEMIAEGISQITGIRVSRGSLICKRARESQTRKRLFERWLNVRDKFALKDADAFNDRHVLIVDDVLTTGSTVESAARCVLQSKDVKVSVLTLAATLL